MKRESVSAVQIFICRILYPLTYTLIYNRINRIAHYIVCTTMLSLRESLNALSPRHLYGSNVPRSATDAVRTTQPHQYRLPSYAYSAAEESRAKSFAKDVFAGTCGGIAVVLVGHPFDTVKILLQTQSSTKPAYDGMVDCAKKVVAESGFMGLYKGVQAPLVGQMFFRAALFFSVARFKTLFDASPDNMLGYGLAGSAAWGVATVVESPIDLYKSQMQKQLVMARQDPLYKPPFTTMLGAVRQSFAFNGAMAPFQGASASLARNIPAAGVYFYTFEQLKLRLAQSAGLDKPTSGHLFVAGGLAGFAYWVFFFPLDVIKSQMQCDSLDKAQRRYTSVPTTIRLLLADGGIPRLYRGVAPCLLRAIPANATMLFTVDKVRTYLDSE